MAENNSKLSHIYLINRFSKISKGQTKPIESVKNEKIKLLYLRNNLYRPRFARGLEKEGKFSYNYQLYKEKYLFQFYIYQQKLNH